MLINRPNRVVGKVGDYSIIVASDKSLEDGDKFDKFCKEFQMVMAALFNQLSKPKESIDVTPVAANESVS